jgi:hypothetical protein
MYEFFVAELIKLSRGHHGIGGQLGGRADDADLARNGR